MPTFAQKQRPPERCAPWGHSTANSALWGERALVADTDSAAPRLSVREVLGAPGRALDQDTRRLMELRLGHDFSRVRVHADSRAAASARAMNAIAYTVGHDVVLPANVGDSRLLAHELAHVVQQTNRGPMARVATPDHGAESEANNAADAIMAGRAFRPSLRTGLAVHRQAPPPPRASLAGLTATRDAFNNAGAPDAANCAANPPAALGVDGPGLGANGMEMVFRLHGAIPAGTEFEITRTKATGTWQREGGVKLLGVQLVPAVWSRLGGDPAGTSDDRHDDDECHTPVGNRIFTTDGPSIGAAGLNPRGSQFPDGTTISATATAAVRKHSFAEWVMARNRRLGIGWQQISTPTFHRWHSVISVEHVAGVWTRVPTPSGQKNEIELGSTPTTRPTP